MTPGFNLFPHRLKPEDVINPTVLLADCLRLLIETVNKLFSEFVRIVLVFLLLFAYLFDNQILSLLITKNQRSLCNC